MKIPDYRKWVSVMEVPEDLVCGEVHVEMTGKNIMCICNYLGIIEFTSDRLLLQCKEGRLEIIGNNLIIESYTKDELYLRGIIWQTQYI